MKAVSPYTHPLPAARGESCGICGERQRPATHKVEEVTDDPRHPFTAYVCCGHFGMIMGELAGRSCTVANRIAEDRAARDA